MSSRSGGRDVHTQENPHLFCAVGLNPKPAISVRGSSRRITSMRFRPANTRMINRRADRLDRHFYCLLRVTNKQYNHLFLARITIPPRLPILEDEFERQLK
jgi:hypothetical protein